MNLQDVFYHGIRDQVRRVVSLMTDAEIERGLNAFENGRSNWSQCFFAQAFPALDLDHGEPEQKLMLHFGFKTAIPIRIVYQTFDGCGVAMTKQQLADFIRAVRIGETTKEQDDIIKALKFDEDKPVEVCAL